MTSVEVPEEFASAHCTFFVVIDFSQRLHLVAIRPLSGRGVRKERRMFAQKLVRGGKTTAIRGSAEDGHYQSGGHVGRPTVIGVARTVANEPCNYD